jgi:hypothetical protein
VRDKTSIPVTINLRNESLYAYPSYNVLHTHLSLGFFNYTRTNTTSKLCAILLFRGNPLICFASQTILLSISCNNPTFFVEKNYIFCVDTDSSGLLIRWSDGRHLRERPAYRPKHQVDSVLYFVLSWLNYNHLVVDYQLLRYCLDEISHSSTFFFSFSAGYSSCGTWSNLMNYPTASCEVSAEWGP